MNPKIVGEFIQYLRKQKRLTQSELSELIGVTDKAVSRWETGEGFPEITILPKLASVLGVSTDEILSGKYQKDKEKNNDQKYISRFNLHSLINVIIIFSGFLIGVIITNTTYNIWYGLIPLLISYIGALVYYLLVRTFFIEKCEWNEQEKRVLFKNTSLIYMSMIISFGMYYPYIGFHVQLLKMYGFVVGILNIGDFVVSSMVFGVLSLNFGYLIRLIHESIVFKKPLPALFTFGLFSILYATVVLSLVSVDPLINRQIGLLIVLVFILALWILGLIKQTFKWQGVFLLIALLLLGVVTYLNYVSWPRIQSTIIHLLCIPALTFLTVYSVVKLKTMQFMYYFFWLTYFVMSMIIPEYFETISMIWYGINIVIIFVLEHLVNKIKTP